MKTIYISRRRGKWPYKVNIKTKSEHFQEDQKCSYREAILLKETEFCEDNHRMVIMMMIHMMIKVMMEVMMIHTIIKVMMIHTIIKVMMIHNTIIKVMMIHKIIKVMMIPTIIKVMMIHTIIKVMMMTTKMFLCLSLSPKCQTAIQS